MSRWVKTYYLYFEKQNTKQILQTVVSTKQKHAGMLLWVTRWQQRINKEKSQLKLDVLSNPGVKIVEAVNETQKNNNKKEKPRSQLTYSIFP